MKATYESMREDFENNWTVEEQINKWNDFWWDHPKFNEYYRVFGWDDSSREIMTDIARVYDLDAFDLFKMKDWTYCNDFFAHYDSYNNALESYSSLSEMGDDYDVFIGGLVAEANEDEDTEE